MATFTLYDDGFHKNVVIYGFEHGESVPANQHLIVHGDTAIILDPGGHKVYAKVLSETRHLLGRAKLEYMILSHQDPDIVAAVNGWLMTTDVVAYAPATWVRFIPHFGVDSLVLHRLKPVPDEGGVLQLDATTKLHILPAHFLHSVGNIQVFDPVSRILYSGDLGASVGVEHIEVTDFAAHVPHLTGFHRRYMVSRKAAEAWARMVEPLGVDIIAPQHGAVFRGPTLTSAFIDWCRNMECGVDLLGDTYPISQAVLNR